MLSPLSRSLFLPRLQLSQLLPPPREWRASTTQVTFTVTLGPYKIYCSHRRAAGEAGGVQGDATNPRHFGVCARSGLLATIQIGGFLRAATAHCRPLKVRWNERGRGLARRAEKGKQQVMDGAGGPAADSLPTEAVQQANIEHTVEWRVSAFGINEEGKGERGTMPLPDQIAAAASLYPSRFNPRLQATLEGIYRTRGALPKNGLDRKCARCWMMPEHCFCRSIESLPLGPNGVGEAEVEVVVYFHWREASLRKASNTAKLVPLTLPAGRLLACGDAAAELTLFNRLESGRSAAVLFPGEGAITVSEWWREVTTDRTERHIAEDNASEPARDDGGDLATRITEQSRPLLVVLDGTWAEARLLNKFLPAAAPRVMLSGVPAELTNLRTRWGHPDKANIQSFPAIIAALAECGCPESSVSALTGHLVTAIDRYVDQTFPEKAQKPHYVRQDKQQDPSLLARAVAETKQRPVSSKSTEVDP